METIDDIGLGSILGFILFMHIGNTQKDDMVKYINISYRPLERFSPGTAF